MAKKQPPTVSTTALERLDSDEHGVMELTRRVSVLELAVTEYDERASADLRRLEIAQPEELDAFQLELGGCVFVGHLATDMDSVGSAIGAAELFGGIASRASELNSESEFALEHFGIPPPPPFEEVAGERNVCLVDHCQTSQMHPAVVASRIRGIIDHHALQSSTVTTDTPIYVDIRPWGSACTIVAHTFVAMRRSISRQSAAVLLCGILSDTLNLRSPTTTPHDRRLVSLLCRTLSIGDPNELAAALFRAKSRTLTLLSAHQLLRGDQKTFEFTRPGGRMFSVGFGVVETTDVAAMLARADELLLESRALKREEALDAAFLALVDIVNLCSVLLVCGPIERALAERAFGGVTSASHVLDLGARVSRKKNFVPPLANVLGSDFALPDAAADTEDFGTVVQMCTPTGCMTVRRMAFADVGAVAMAAAHLRASMCHDHHGCAH